MDLLDVWELSHIRECFAEQNITSLDIFCNLSDGDLREIIPTLGDRIKFKLKLKQYIEEQKINENQKIDINTPVVLEIEEEEPEIKRMCLVNDNTQSNSTVILVEEDTSTITSNASFTSSLTSADFEYVMKNSEIVNLNLKIIIEEHIIGRAILTKYDRCKKLEIVGDRNSLSDIIICYFLNQGKRLTNESISILAEKIVELFPTEHKSTYFVSPIPKRRSKGNKPEVAKGKLVDKHRNKLTMIRKSLEFTKQKKSVLENVQEIDIDQNVIDSQIWLKHNMGPEEEVLQHWKNSYTLRNKTTADLFKEWPILETQLALQLINSDYVQKYMSQDQSINISGRFDLLFGSVYEKRNHLLKPSDELFREQLEDADTSSDSKVAIRLYLLAALIPPKGRTQISGRKQWKPSISECRDALFLQAKAPGDIEKLKKERLDILYSKGLTVQPYIMLVGPCLNNITASYVILNNFNYKTSSVLEAIQFCFQACIILDVKYAFECQHIWYLFQWYIFKIKNSSDPKIPYISDLLEHI